MNIIPDPFLLVLQALPFLVTLIALHYIIFRPMLAHLHDRDVAIDGAQKEVVAIQEKAEAMMADIDARMVRAREESAALRSQLHQVAARARDEMIQKAREEADSRHAAALREIHSARDAARVQMGLLTTSLADDIARQVLHRAAE